MADALVWQLIRANNSFLVKRGRTSRDGAVQFSTEPGNLLNVNSHKYSGIANKHVIGVNGVNSSSDKRKSLPKVVVSIKSDKALNKPSKTTSSSAIKNAAGLKASIKGYRPDLANAAAIRYSKLYRGTLAKKGLVKAKKSSNSRNLRKAKK